MVHITNREYWKHLRVEGTLKSKNSEVEVFGSIPLPPPPPSDNTTSDDNSRLVLSGGGGMLTKNEERRRQQDIFLRNQEEFFMQPTRLATTDNFSCVSVVYRFRGWAMSFPLLLIVCTPAKDDSPQKRTAIRY